MEETPNTIINSTTLIDYLVVCSRRQGKLGEPLRVPLTCLVYERVIDYCKVCSLRHVVLSTSMLLIIFEFVSRRIPVRSPRRVNYLEDVFLLPDKLPELVQPGDVVLTLGAGNIGRVARELVGEQSQGMEGGIE